MEEKSQDNPQGYGSPENLEWLSRESRKMRWMLAGALAWTVLVGLVWDWLGGFGPLLMAPGVFVLFDTQCYRLAFSSPEKLALLIAREAEESPPTKSRGLSRIVFFMTMLFCLALVLSAGAEIIRDDDPKRWFGLFPIGSATLLFAACAYVWSKRRR